MDLWPLSRSRSSPPLQRPKARIPSTTKPGHSAAPKSSAYSKPSTRPKRRRGSRSTPSWYRTRGWKARRRGRTYNFPQDAYNTMVPDFREGDFAAGLVAGAREIQGEPAAQGAQKDPDGSTGGLVGGGGLLLLLVAVTGGLLLFRKRRANKRRIEEERRSAEEEFANLTVHLNEFDEKERLASGYLVAQRSLLDQRTEESLEMKISDAKTTGFAQEFDEAASRLTSDPIWARERMEHGRNLLAESIQKLHEAERTMDDYRAADEALEGKLHE